MANYFTINFINNKTYSPDINFFLTIFDDTDPALLPRSIILVF